MVTPVKKAAKKAARPVKKAVKKAAARPYDPFPNISQADKERLAELILNFDEPDICPEGRRKFLQSVKFPIPGATALVNLTFKIPVSGEEIETNHWGGLSLTDEGTFREHIHGLLEFPMDWELEEGGTYVDEIQQA